MTDTAPMTKTEFHAILTAFDWTLGDLARHAKRDGSRVRKMASGSGEIDAPLAEWLRALAKIQAAFDGLLAKPPVKPKDAPEARTEAAAET
jgi:hypothetical protein